MNELLLDNNKLRICEIFQLDNNLPDSSIISKIKNSSYSYFVQTWENINPQTDDLNIYRVISMSIYDNIKRFKDYKLLIPTLIKNLNICGDIVDGIYQYSKDNNFILNLLNIDYLKDMNYDNTVLVDYYLNILTKDILLGIRDDYLHYNGKEMERKTLFGVIYNNLIHNAELHNKTTEIDIENTPTMEDLIISGYKIFDKIIKMGIDTRNDMINWIIHYINTNIDAAKMYNITREVEDDNFINTNRFSKNSNIAIVMGILLQYWENNKNLDVLDIQYLLDNDIICSKDRLHSEPQLLTKNDNYISINMKIFTFIHKLNHLSMMVIFEKYHKYKNLIVDYENIIKDIPKNNIWDSLGKMKEFYVDKLEKKIHNIEMKLKDNRKIYKDTYLRKLLLHFHNDFFQWLINLYQEKQDTIIQNIPSFWIDDILDYGLEFIKPFYGINIQFEKTIECCILLMGDNNNITNPYLRTKASKLISYIIPEYRNKPYLHLDICQQHLLPNLIKLYVEIENTGSDNQFYQKFEPRYHISYLFRHILTEVLEPNYRDILQTVSNNNSNMYKRFIIMNLSDLNFLLEEIVNSVKKIKNVLVRIPLEQLTRIMSLLKSDLLFSYEQLELLYTCSKYLNNQFITHEIITQFVPMANYFIKFFINEDMSVKDRKIYGYKPEKIVELFSKVYLEISHSDNVIQEIILDKRSYYPKLFEDMSNYLLTVNKITELEKVNFQMIQTIIESKIKKRNNRVILIDDNEIPDDIMDPIMCSIMKEPILLPSSKKIMDKSVICRYLLSDQEDPFNREPLDIEELEQFNRLPETIELMKPINNKIKQYHWNRLTQQYLYKLDSTNLVEKLLLVLHSKKTNDNNL